MAEMQGNIGTVTVSVEVDMVASEQFDQIANMLGYSKERTCRMEYDNIKRDVYCSHCGARMNVYTWEHHVDGTAGYLYPFCYWCGAKVVE